MAIGSDHGWTAHITKKLQYTPGASQPPEVKYTFCHIWSWVGTSGHISHTKFENFDKIFFDLIEFYIMLHEVDRDYFVFFADADA